MKWFTDFIRRKRSKTIKVSSRSDTKAEFSSKGINAPFVGSDLKSSEKEAIAFILAETVREKQKTFEDIITTSEIYEIIKKLGEKTPTVYEIFPQACWNAFWEMGDEGLLEIHQADGPSEGWIRIVPNTVLAKLVGV